MTRWGREEGQVSNLPLRRGEVYSGENGMGPRIREDKREGDSSFSMVETNGGLGWGEGDGVPASARTREGDSSFSVVETNGGLGWGERDGSPHPRGQEGRGFVFFFFYGGNEWWVGLGRRGWGPRIREDTGRGFVFFCGGNEWWVGLGRRGWGPRIREDTGR